MPKVAAVGSAMVAATTHQAMGAITLADMAHHIAEAVTAIGAQVIGTVPTDSF